MLKNSLKRHQQLAMELLRSLDFKVGFVFRDGKRLLSNKNSFRMAIRLVRKRRRGTAIVDTPKGILVVSRDNRMFFLPGGGAEGDETRREAAIRELKEETNLWALDCCFLFEFTSFLNSHKVFLMETAGVATPGNEIRYIDYFDGSNLRVSNTTWEIIELYHSQQK
jgi:8-oxo-dGTP diphosphatase